MSIVVEMRPMPITPTLTFSLAAYLRTLSPEQPGKMNGKAAAEAAPRNWRRFICIVLLPFCFLVYAILPSAMSVNTIVKMATVSTMPSAAR